MNVFLVLIIDLFVCFLMYLIYDLYTKIRNVKDFDNLYIIEVNENNNKEGIKAYKVEQKDITLQYRDESTLNIKIKSLNEIEGYYHQNKQTNNVSVSLGMPIKINEYTYVIGEQSCVDNFEKIPIIRIQNVGISKNTYATRCFFILIVLSILLIYVLMNNTKETDASTEPDKTAESESNSAQDFPPDQTENENISALEKETFSTFNSDNNDTNLPGEKLDEYYYGFLLSKYQQTLNWNELEDSLNPDFVFIQIGRRSYQKNDLKEDLKFEEHLKDALSRELPVVVDFYSSATNEEEAIEEANFVIETLNSIINDDEFDEFDKNLINSIAFWWENDGEDAKLKRHKDVSTDKSIEIANTFCELISQNGYQPIIGGNSKWISSIIDSKELKFHSLYVYHYPSHEDDKFDEMAVRCDYILYDENDTLNIYDSNDQRSKLALIKHRK